MLFPERAIDAGSTAPSTISATNTGIGDLSISGITKTGTGAPHFVVTGDTGQTLLAPGQERLVSVAFDPYSVGDKVAYINFASNDPANPMKSVYLWGNAYAGGEIDVTPTSWTWPYQSIPDAPAMPGTVTITNTGAGGLSLSSVALTGTDPGQFLITDDTGQTSLSTSQSRVVDVTFNPTTPGVKTAALRISSNDADEPTVNVALSGTGFDPVAGYTSPVWVDPAYAGIEQGTETQPCNTLAEGCDLVLVGGTVIVKPGTCGESLRLTKPMRVEAATTPVTIGAPAPPASSVE